MSKQAEMGKIGRGGLDLALKMDEFLLRILAKSLCAETPRDGCICVSSGDKGFIITQLTGWASRHSIGQGKPLRGSCTVCVAKKF